MKQKENIITASEFKKHLLSLVDQVNKSHSTFTITKRKIPVAKVVPIEDASQNSKNSHFGFLKGAVKIKKDIINCSFESEWESNQE